MVEIGCVNLRNNVDRYIESKLIGHACDVNFLWGVWNKEIKVYINDSFWENLLKYKFI
jgi:hypothetical protein